MTENSYLAFARGLVIQLASVMATFLLHSNVDTIVLHSLTVTIKNNYCISCFTRGLVAQRASAMVVFSLSCVDTRDTGLHSVSGQPVSARRFAPHECISMTNHVFCTWPYCSDQSLGHKTTLSEIYIHVYIYIIIYSNMTSKLREDS